jgi:energy-coupling factor transporter ATP-binding protein EcfA2
MRIERLRIPAFGPLRDLDTGPDPLPGFVVVTGPNEAGKSSFLEAISTLLHGIYPVRRDAHPLVPWDGTEAAVLGEVRTRGGAAFAVHRRILASPWGRLEREGTEEDLRNAQLPGVEHVPEAIYRQVHAITPSELAELQEGKAWEAIRDRILAGMGTRDLRPPRKVAEGLEEAAAALWRNDRRGQPVDRQLGARIEAGTRAVREARQMDQELRQARESLASGEDRLRELRRERAELDERVHQATRLLPLAARIRHLADLRATAGDVAELAGLPASPRERRRELVEAEEAAASELEAAEAAFRTARERRPPPVAGDDALLARQDRLQALQLEARGADEARSRVLRLGMELDRARDEVASLAAPLLEDPVEDPEGWSRAPERDDLLHALQRVPLDELRERLVERGTAARRESDVAYQLEQLRARPSPPPPRARARSTLPLLLGMSGLLLLAALASLLRGTAAPWAGLLVLAGGVALGGVALWLRSRDLAALRRHHRDQEARKGEEDALEERRRLHHRHLEESTGRVRSLLGELALRPGRLDDAGEGLATALERLRDQLRLQVRLERELGEEEGRVTAVLARIHALADELVDEPAIPGAGAGGDPEAVTALLAPLLARLEEARRRQEQATEAEREIAGAQRRRDEAALRCSSARDRREALDRDLLAIHPGREGGPPWAGALEEVERRLDAWRQLRDLERELESAHGSLEELSERVEAAAREWGAEPGPPGDPGPGEPRPGDVSLPDLAAARGRLEALAEEVERTAAAVQRDRSRLEQADTVATVDLLESELARLREERADLRRERDRLWLLARITQVAEMRFREAHQPALIHRAEALLVRLTRGRYDTLILGDDRDPEALQVRGFHLPGHLPVESPLSTGTREQIWFALRMAVVDLVEGGGEPLPLALDELLVNWDPERQGAALDTLAELSQDRQIFLVTCHPALAREAEVRGARVLELATPPTRPAFPLPDPIPDPG